MFSMFGVISAYSESRVDIVVAGYINHGPMQPTVTAIKEVISKYGDKISITWIDMNTASGMIYCLEHGLSAHLNILIDGAYQYTLNGKSITFQWFEGGSWTKEDLDAVISNLLNNTGNAVPVMENNSIYLAGAVVAAILVVLIVGIFVIRKRRKAKR
jgi:hypothetical protein